MSATHFCGPQENVNGKCRLSPNVHKSQDESFVPPSGICHDPRHDAVMRRRHTISRPPGTSPLTGAGARRYSPFSPQDGHTARILPPRRCFFWRQQSLIRCARVARPLDQPKHRHRHGLAAADHQMIEHTYPDQLQRVPQIPRNGPIGSTGLGHARRVVVRQDDG